MCWSARTATATPRGSASRSCCARSTPSSIRPCGSTTRSHRVRSYRRAVTRRTAWTRTARSTGPTQPFDLREQSVCRTFVRYDQPVRTLRHWWNGATGDSAAEVVRRDVYLRTDGRRWEVEATEGAIGEHSARARSTRRTYSD